MTNRAFFFFEKLSPIVGVADFRIVHAMEQIKADYGVEVAPKWKTLFKFGQNAVLAQNAEATVMEFAGSEVTETYATTNSVDSFVSSDAALSGSIYIEGHYFAANGTDKVFHTQTITATGETPVSLTQPLCRATRIENRTGTALAGTDKGYVYDSTANVGGVTAGVPQTASSVKLIMSAGKNKSYKAATSVSYIDYWLITQVYGDVNKKQTANVDWAVKFRTGNSGLLLPVFEHTASTAGTSSVLVNLEPGILIPANSDVAMTATSDASSPTSFSGGMNGYLLTAA